MDINEGLGQSAVDLNSLTIEDGCTINIGTATSPLQIRRAAGVSFTWGGTGTTYLQIAGDESGGTFYAKGAGTLYLSSYSNEETFDNLFVTGTSGTVYLAWKSDEYAKFDVIRMSGAGTLQIGTNVVDTTASQGASITMSAGTAYSWSAAGALYMRAGSITFYDIVPTQGVHIYGGTVYFTGSGGGPITDITMYGGSLYHNSSATITAITQYDGTIDFSANAYGCTVTTADIYGDAVFNDPNNAVAVGTVFNFYGTDASNASVNFGVHRKITTADIS